MSIADQIERINQQKKIIATKTTQFGLTDNDTANLETLATAIKGIEYHDCADVNLTRELGCFEIIKGYHEGGMVYWVNDDSTEDVVYKLYENKSVVPVKNEDQLITIPDGYYGFGSFTVKKIPHPYHDVSKVDALVGEVVSGKKFVDADGAVKVGEMRNNGAMNITLKYEDAVTPVTIPEGYYSGGTVGVAVNTEVTEVIPSDKDQNVQPGTDGKFFLGVKVKGDANLAEGNIASGVTIFGKTGTYTNDATVDYTTENTSPDVYEGKTAYVKGKKVTGTLKNRGAIIETIDGLTQTSFLSNNSGYYSSINVTLSGDIETELAKI